MPAGTVQAYQAAWPVEPAVVPLMDAAACPVTALRTAWPSGLAEACVALTGAPAAGSTICRWKAPAGPVVVSTRSQYVTPGSASTTARTLSPPGSEWSTRTRWRIAVPV